MVMEYVGKTIVLKIGGEAVMSPEFPGVVADIGQLVRAGVKVAVVHGGGPQATALTKRLGLEPRIVGGRRITDAETLEVMKMVLSGQIGTDLAALFRRQKVSAVALSGVSGDILHAKKRPPRVVSGGGPEAIDFGYVGDILSVSTEILEMLMNHGVVPLLNSLGVDDFGQILNINADVAATRIAVALGARKLFMLTGASGVFRDISDPSSRISTLTVAEGKKLIADNIVTGGMIPKLEESFGAIAAGIPEVHIFSSAAPHALLLEFTAETRTGTMLCGAQ
ncbi:MAG: acetylglutamate kinase [Myxococcales bacterium]|nr:acetylglutamate kinase [Myxococcales bacterium]